MRAHDDDAATAGPAGASATATVARLGYAPVKALGHVRVDALDLGPDGVPADRALLLVEASGRLVENAHHPRLLAVRPAYDAATRTLELTFPDGTRTHAALEPEAEPGEVHHYDGRPTRVRLAAPTEHDAALSAFAGEPLRIAVRTDPGGGCADSPLTLSSDASLQEVAAHLGEPDLDPARFRHSIEIVGVGAREEERWIGSEIAVGDAVLRVIAHVDRCVVTTLDPRTGVRDQPVLKALRQLRGKRDIRFGVHAEVVRPGRIAVGDRLRTAADPSTGPRRDTSRRAST